jgi:hypothetical protein
VTARLLETYDVLMVLAPLLEARPWESQSGGKLRRFVQGQWGLVGEAEARKMHRCEAQAWLAVYNLLVDGSVRSKYALTSFRRNQLLRLRGFLNEATVDQVPLAPARSPASPRPSPTPNPPSVDQVSLALTLALTLAITLSPNPTSAEQIPVLTELQRAMDELQLMDQSQIPSHKPAYVLEQLLTPTPTLTLTLTPRP